MWDLGSVQDGQIHSVIGEQTSEVPNQTGSGRRADRDSEGRGGI